MRRFMTLLLTTGFILVFATGCWNPFGGGDNGDDDGGGSKNRLTRNNLMEFFAYAYEEENIEHYEESLHDKFLFQFTPAVAETLGLPPAEPWWGKTEDVASTRNMFEEATVTAITMQLDYVINWYGCVDLRQHEVPPDTIEGWCARFDATIDVTIEEPGKEPLTLIVRDSYLDVIVTPDPKSTTGEWVIVRIEEKEK
jgi:hypothetical protein